MESFKRILVVSRMNPYSRKAVHLGISLARKYDATLHVLHLVTTPMDLFAVNASGLFPEAQYTQYINNQQDAQEQLDKIIKEEIRLGFPIQEQISELGSVEEVEKMVVEENIDLLVMVAHAEGRIEHALFGGENSALIRGMPCSILLVKDEPGSLN
jgi:nucleotide-binding universal stress UspA family protein